MPSPKEKENGDEFSRRRRYERGKPQHGMTAAKVRLLSHIAECGMLTTSQAARIAGIGEESAYKHLRHLFDLGMLERIAVPYANLAPPDVDGPGLAFGPGQNIHVPTRAAIQYLERAGQISEEAAARKLPDYGPKNALFLSHELLVRDVRVWLELCAQTHGGFVERWLDGSSAHIPPARPDAWFLLKISVGTLLGFVEADRGTERGDQWEKKIREYDELLGSEAMKIATGRRRRARLLVVTLTEARREKLSEQLAASAIADSAYVATANDLYQSGLDRPVWRHQADLELQPLVSPKILLGDSQAESGD